jgi:hypothetical protein
MNMKRDGRAAATEAEAFGDTKMTGKQQPPIELLKHLRAIHFLIVLASLLTLLAVFSGPSGDVSATREQLERVATIGNSWETWTKRFALEQVDWLKSLGIKWLDEGPEPVFIETQQLKDHGLIPASETPIWRLRLDGLPIYFFLSITPRNEPSRKLILAMPYGRLNVSDTLPLDISFPGLGGSHPFATIEQFRDFWESARQPMAWFASELAPVAHFFVGQDVAATLPIKMHPGAGSTLDFKNSSLGGCRDESVRAAFEKVHEESYDAFFCRDIHAGSMIIATRFREPRIPADLQQWLIKSFDLPGPAGTFSDSFPELDRVTRNYQELALEKARAILEAELARGGERIEFLGMKLPETLMATWGGVVILMLQLYLWLHLRAVRGVRRTSKWVRNEVAWIGIYSDIFARGTTLATVFLLPFGTTVCAVMIADVSVVVAVILSLLVGCVSGLSARRVWNLSERPRPRKIGEVNEKQPSLLPPGQEAEQFLPADAHKDARG